MALPNVNIRFANGNISTVSPSADSVCGMIVSAQASGTFALGKAYQIFHSNEAVELGLDKTNNAFAYEQIRQFYAQAGEGAELWIYGVAKAKKPSEMVDKDGTIAMDFLQSANGRIRVLAACWDTEGQTTVSTDFSTAMTKAQALGEHTTSAMYAPILVVLNYYGYKHGDAATMPDLKTMANNRVAVLVGGAETESTCALGLLLGRIAQCEVQTHIGRVKDGALKVEKAFIGAKDASVGASEALDLKGYITFRTFVGKAGYFFTDDHTATADSDDYHTVCNRRVIDKAYRVCYSALLEKANDEIPVEDDGTMPTAIAHSIQGMVETALQNNMTALGNLGVNPNDDNDTGVKAYVDPSQNVVRTSKIEISIKVKPYGYARYIDATLGFFTI